MSRWGILGPTIGFLLVILAGYASAQGQVGECAAEHEMWSTSMAGLRNQLEMYRRIKGESLEPKIMEQLKSASETRTTVARIVRSAIREHDRKVAEAEQEMRRAADGEKIAFADWHACVRSGHGGSGKSDRATFQTALKDRQRLLKELDALLLN